MNHAGEIAGLTRQARPHVAVVTTVAAAHLEFFGSVEAIADAKGEIFEGLRAGRRRGAQPGRRGVRAAGGRRPGLRCRAHRHFRRRCRCRLPAARLPALDADGSDVAARLDGRPLRYRVGVAGRHWVPNSLAVLAAVEALGADVDGGGAIPGRSRAAGRPRRPATPIAAGDGHAVLLDESYNANPASVRAALDVLGRLPGRRIAVLGDMRELGLTAAAACTPALADAVEAAGVTRLSPAGR